MVGVMDPGPILLSLDVAIEIAADALELCNHGLDLGDLAAPLVDLKLLQANECLGCLHRPVPPPTPPAPTRRRSRRSPSPLGGMAQAGAQCARTMFSFRFPHQ